MQKIFISFRAEDTRSEARNIYQSLKNEFGSDKVFFFHESNQMGDYYLSNIDTALKDSNTFLLLIGENFLVKDAKTNKPRLENREDLVRKEIEEAFRPNLHIIPILIKPAVSLDSSSLPESIRDVCKLDHLELTMDRAYEFAIQALINRIKGIIKVNVYCTIQVNTEANSTKTLLYKDKTKLIDQNGGVEYPVTDIILSDLSTGNNSYLEKELVSNIPVVIKLRFEPGKKVDVVGRLNLQFWESQNRDHIIADFNNIFVK